MRSLRLVPPLPPGIKGDEGMIGQNSIVWRIARDKRVILGGPSALLLQVAHPMVAAGVADHSTFERDPLKRLIGTLHATLVTTFGDSKQAAAAARAVREVHRRIHGPLDKTRGAWQAGSYYSAFSPDLCLWVYATLVQLALDSYSEFVRELSFEERERYYHESAPFGELFGVTSQVRPSDYGDFLGYYHTMLEQLVVDERAKQIAQSIFDAKLYGIPVSPLGQVFAAGLLPAPIRQAYGLNWGWATRVAWQTCRLKARLAGNLAPARWLHWQHYHMAQARVVAD